MKTLADFKRKLIVGNKVKSQLYWLNKDGDYELQRDFGERDISVVQTNAFAFRTTKTDGTTTDSWCQMPKASDLVIVDSNTVKVNFWTDNNSKISGGYLIYEFL